MHIYAHAHICACTDTHMHTYAHARIGVGRRVPLALGRRRAACRRSNTRWHGGRGYLHPRRSAAGCFGIRLHHGPEPVIISLCCDPRARSAGIIPAAGLPAWYVLRSAGKPARTRELPAISGLAHRVDASPGTPLHDEAACTRRGRRRAASRRAYAALSVPESQ